VKERYSLWGITSTLPLLTPYSAPILPLIDYQFEREIQNELGIKGGLTEQELVDPSCEEDLHVIAV